MMLFNDFFQKYGLKNKATTNIKTYQVLSSLSWSDIGMYLRDGPFESELGIVNLHPPRGAHWVAYLNHYYFYSYACPPPRKLLNYIKSKHGKCLYSD